MTSIDLLSDLWSDNSNSINSNSQNIWGSNYSGFSNPVTLPSLSKISSNSSNSSSDYEFHNYTYNSSTSSSNSNISLMNMKTNLEPPLVLNQQNLNVNVNVVPSQPQPNVGPHKNLTTNIGAISPQGLHSIAQPISQLPQNLPNLSNLPNLQNLPQNLPYVPVNSSTGTGISPTLSQVETEDKKPVNTQLYKTELCDSFMKNNFCPYGNKCQFAHGSTELKIVERPANWRSKPCVNWSKFGTCRYGNRCCFKHD